MRLLILLLLISCGKNESKCMSREEAILRCKADLVQRYYPMNVPEYDNQTCERNYLVNACY